MALVYHGPFPLTPALPMNLQIPPLITNNLRILRFRGSMRELFRGILSRRRGRHAPRLASKPAAGLVNVAFASFKGSKTRSFSPAKARMRGKAVHHFQAVASLAA